MQMQYNRLYMNRIIASYYQVTVGDNRCSNKYNIFE